MYEQINSKTIKFKIQITKKFNFKKQKWENVKENYIVKGIHSFGYDQEGPYAFVTAQDLYGSRLNLDDNRISFKLFVDIE